MIGIPSTVSGQGQLAANQLLPHTYAMQNVLILDGRDVADGIIAEASQSAVRVSQRIGRAPCLAAVALQPPPGVPLFFGVKQRAFEAGGLRFLPNILASDADTSAIVARIRALNADESIDGIYLQYPLPPHVDERSAFAAIASAKDVDGALWSGPSYPFAPATAESVTRLLLHHGITLAHADTALVCDDPAFSAALAWLLECEAASPRIISSSAFDKDALRGADIVVVATGRPNGVDAAAVPDGSVVVDVGYYHAGGAGDIAASEADVHRMKAYAMPRGAIGPLTIALLMEHTVRAAGRLAQQREME